MGRLRRGRLHVHVHVHLSLRGQVEGGGRRGAQLEQLPQVTAGEEAALLPGVVQDAAGQQQLEYLPLVYLFFNCAFGDEAVDRDWPLLPQTPSAFSGLYVRLRVPVLPLEVNISTHTTYLHTCIDMHRHA